MHPLTRPPRQHGFTLAEMAIVLLILTILTAALAVPLGGRLEAQQRQRTAAMMEDIEAALIGFAIVHRRLPCPSTERNPAAPRYGLEDLPVAGQCPVGTEGMLPWRTLGLPPFDAWGAPRAVEADPWFGYWRYRVDRNFSRVGAGTEIAIGTGLADAIGVVDHDGHGLTAAGQEAVALVYSTGEDRQPNGLNASYEAGGGATYQQGEPTTAFDDMVVWFGRPLLVARMAEAGAF